MKDVEPKRKLRLISLQLESWKKLHDLVTYGLDKAKPIISAERNGNLGKCERICCRKPSTFFRELNLLNDLSAGR